MVPFSLKRTYTPMGQSETCSEILWTGRAVFHLTNCLVISEQGPNTSQISIRFDVREVRFAWHFCECNERFQTLVLSQCDKWSLAVLHKKALGGRLHTMYLALQLIVHGHLLVSMITLHSYSSASLMPIPLPVALSSCLM